jgi:hypothetical protein
MRLEISMRMLLAVAPLLCGLSVHAYAQTADPNLTREAMAVRAELARSLDALRHYIWTETTEVFVDGKLNLSTDHICRYNASGTINRALVEAAGEGKASTVSRRPLVRGKADLQDYVERAVSRIREYAPPEPKHIDYLLQNGFASPGKSQSGTSEIRLTNYFEKGDLMVFTYNVATKRLVQVDVNSTLGSPKDPLTLQAVFETLPDGVNHLVTATLQAPRKKVQVNVRNVAYQKAAN